MHEAGPDEFTHLLWEIGEAGVRFFVVGGQAVNKWAEEFLSRERAVPRRWSGMRRRSGPRLGDLVMSSHLGHDKT